MTTAALLPTKADEAFRYADLAALATLWPLPAESVDVAAGESGSLSVVLAGDAPAARDLAITLGEVILFRPGERGEADPRIWAHELVHVQQYDRWGVRGFAQRYTADHLAVEREAQDGAARYVAAIGK